ncbi:hypothetical protein CHS0354_009108 [Potamilus streckersoni]|uniref:TIR domain-containing protein n=1 Tax=Potamilus streckersoni TaxID=2493646 RepID=A0AAE0SXV0_9BIVA|nr:hypothetical protein CHS0354_009108 [Potamilus streckersoni]
MACKLKPRRWTNVTVIMASVLQVVLPNRMCPPSCGCSYVEKELRRHLDVRCFVPQLEELDLSPLRSVTEPYSLYVHCSSYATSELKNYALSALHSCTDLSLHSCRIYFFQRYALYGLSALKGLYVEGANDISMGVQTFTSNPYLQSLSIVNSRLLHLPEICDLQMLKNVNMSGNGLLKVSNSGLVCMDSTKILNLEIIDLSRNKLKDITNLIEQTRFPKLEAFYLSGNQIRFDDANESLANIGNLQTLDLSSNLIDSLPADFIKDNLNIADLDLSNNCLQRIPRNFFANSQKLLRLNLRRCCLDSNLLPELVPVKKLTHLYLSQNNMGIIQQSGAKALKANADLLVLELSFNLIESFPESALQSLEQLVELYLDGNLLRSISKNLFYGLKYLTRLDLQSNQIETIHFEALTSLGSLTHLNLSSNYIKDLPAFYNLSSLLYLDASSNYVNSLFKDTFYGLINIRSISLQKNNIKFLTEDIFNPCPKLEALDLSKNQIEFIEAKTFRDLLLKKLYLDHNLIREIGKTFMFMPTLVELYLSYNWISDSIHNDMFPQTLEILDISHNKINSVRQHAFNGMDRLRTVNLVSNDLQTLAEASVAVSTGRFLQTNFYIEGNPWQCDCEILWLRRWSPPPQGPLIPDLNSTWCTGAYHYPTAPLRKIPEDKFLCQYRKMCNVSCVCCGYISCLCEYECPDECTCSRSKDWSSEHYIVCSNSNVTTIKRNLPKIATDLDLSRNNITTIESLNFIELSYLRHLDLSRNIISVLQSRSFVGLKSLQVLSLYNNTIECIEKGVFSSLETVREVLLQNNMISYIEDGAFDGMKSLNLLNLANNALQKVDNYISHLMFSIPRLFLHDNSWICDCLLYHSLKHMPAAFVNITSDKTLESDISCTLLRNESTVHTSLVSFGSSCPKNVIDVIKGISNNLVSPKQEGPAQTKDHYSVVTTNLTDSDVPDLVETTIRDTSTIFGDLNIGLLFPALLAAIIIILIIFVICRRNFVKVWLYARFKCNVSQNDFVEDNNRYFDAFVAYSPKDEIFVIRELALRLERGRPSYKLVVQHRDIQKNASMQGFIQHNIKSSKRTIMIVSSDCIKNEPWFRYVSKYAMEDSPDRIIIVVLGKLNETELAQPLKSLLRSRQCIHQDDTWFWEKLNYCMPEQHSSSSKSKGTLTETQPYAASDLSAMNYVMMDNEAYEEPLSVSSRPLPSVIEYAGTSLACSLESDFKSCSEGSNVYEEIAEFKIKPDSSCQDTLETKADYITNTL